MKPFVPSQVPRRKSRLRRNPETINTTTTTTTTPTAASSAAAGSTTNIIHRSPPKSLEDSIMHNTKSSSSTTNTNTNTNTNTTSAAKQRNVSGPIPVGGTSSTPTAMIPSRKKEQQQTTTITSLSHHRRQSKSALSSSSSSSFTQCSFKHVLIAGVLFFVVSMVGSFYTMTVMIQESTSNYQTIITNTDHNHNLDDPNNHHQLAGGTTPFWTKHRPSLRRDDVVAAAEAEAATTRTRRGQQSQEQQHRKKSSSGHGPRYQNEVIIDMRDLNSQLPFDNPDGGAWKQGFDVQPVEVTKTKPLHIWIVPHSHCDPGWIKTFDQYFQSQTKQIITSIITALKKDGRRKFIWAEISYFEWWWNEQSTATRADVKRLLQNKQLEFVTGGWVQPDEANSELYAMEIQLQEGHDWINATLGEEYIPVYGWAIDPFGYSPTAAYLWKKYGFKAMLIQRVHYAIKKELALRKHLEFYWRQTWDDNSDDTDNENYDIYTHVMPFFSYDVPHTCGPDPSVCCQFDFRRLPVRDFGQSMTCPWRKAPRVIDPTNVAERSMLLLDQYRKKANLYRHNAVLIPLGDDFRYQTDAEAEYQYNNYQQMFDYINQNVPGVNIQFGTLSDYFNYVLSEQKKQEQENPSEPVPVLKGSFFTYSDVNEDYWSGYFTSRVFDKALDRKLERVLYAAESLGGTRQELQEPRRALSLFQHHDGVTGTAKDHVVEDYASRMFSSIAWTHDWILKKFHEQQQQQQQQQHQGKSSIDSTFLANLKPCMGSRAPRDMDRNLCGGSSEIIVYNPLNVEQKCGDSVVAGRQFEKVVLPCEIPGPLPQSRNNNNNVEIIFDPTTGMMIKPVKEEWKIWKVRAGGAYLFVPGNLVSYDLNANSLVIEEGGYIVKTNNWKRKVIQKEVPSEFGGTAVVFDFVYETFLQNDNEEWIARFTGDIQSGGVFYTDLNGFNFDTHYFRKDMPIQSQVFPMPTLASVQDPKSRMTIISEHAQGTASLEDGCIDVWLDRRLRQDDNRGLGQGVQDNRPTKTRLRVVVEKDTYDPSKEFDVTPLTKHFWSALQHPLEMYGHVDEEKYQQMKFPTPKSHANGLQARNRRREDVRAGLLMAAH